MKALKAIVVGVVVGAAGCAAGPNYRTPKPDAPPQFVTNTSGQTAAAVDLAVWWKSLNDAELDSLVELTSGVKPGDRLVLNISSQIASGQPVSANEAVPAAPGKPLAAKR